MCAVTSNHNAAIHFRGFVRFFLFFWLGFGRKTRFVTNCRSVLLWIFFLYRCASFAMNGWWFYFSLLSLHLKYGECLLTVANTLLRVRVCLFLEYGEFFGIFMLIFNACVSALCLSLALACFYNINVRAGKIHAIFVYLFIFLLLSFRFCGCMCVCASRFAFVALAID